MFKQILVPLDGTSLAECLLPHTITLANAFEPMVNLVRVVDPQAIALQGYGYDPINWQMKKCQAKAYLENVALRLKASGIQAKCEILEGHVAESILRYSQQQRIDLILICGQSTSDPGCFMGKVVNKIIQLARTSIMIVRPNNNEPQATSYRRVLIPLDCSQRAEFVLPAAIKLARCLGSELFLAHVVQKPDIPWRSPEFEEVLNLADQLTEHNREQACKYLSELKRHVNANISTCVIVSDNVAESLQELISRVRADLVVMSAHGHSASARRHYGSVTHTLIAFGDATLLILQDMPRKLLIPSRAEEATIERWGH